MTVSARARMGELIADLRLPVIAAPMFLVSGIELVLAACRAGVVGGFPAPNARSVEELDRWCTTIRLGLGSSASPWALNVVAHRTYDRLEPELALVATHRPPMVISALGSPARLVDAVHDYDGLLLADVATMRHAEKALASGCDGLVLVCAGAGGHTGRHNPFAFVHELRREFDGPLVVSGGICDGRAVAAARVLDADLVYVGTRFIATRESAVPDDYREMVVSCGLDDIVLSDAITGAPANWLAPSFAGFEGRTQPVDFSGMVGGQRRRWRDIWSAGHGLAGATRVGTVAELVEELAAGYEAARCAEHREQMPC